MLTPHSPHPTLTWRLEGGAPLLGRPRRLRASMTERGEAPPAVAGRSAGGAAAGAAPPPSPNAALAPPSLLPPPPVQPYALGVPNQAGTTRPV